jgi:hypothetical protein
MGYLPSTLVPFLDETEAGQKNIAETMEEKGEVLRYKTPGLNLSGDSSFSEIGFYSHEADWPIYEDAEKTQITYPRIDRVKIQSTGDIRSTAENHHLIRAKRFEILAGCPEVNHRPDRRAKNERPLGDNLGDDSALHGGDAHIRAGNRVVIKAEQEICLQVGRTVLSLSDQGFTVKSKVTNSNFENVLDATLGLSPRDGINMFGYNVNVSSAKSFQIGDGYGGSISSTIGVVGVKGREVKIEAYDAVEYAFTTLYALFQIIQCSASGGAALGEAEDVNTAQYVTFTFDILQRIIEVLKNVYEGYQARKKTKDKEDEEKALRAAEAEVAEARKKAKESDDDLDEAKRKLAQDQEDSTAADSLAQKAKEDADNKTAAAEQAEENAQETAAKAREDAEKAQKAKEDRDAAQRTVDETAASADDADDTARRAKEKADTDAETAANKKKEADDAANALRVAQEAVDNDDKALEEAKKRLAKNTETAEDLLADAAINRQKAEDQKKLYDALQEESNGLLKKKADLENEIEKNKKDPKKLKILNDELALTQQSLNRIAQQINTAINERDFNQNAAQYKTGKANAAQREATQAQADVAAIEQRRTDDNNNLATARSNADTTRSDSDDAQRNATQSRQASTDADNAATTKHAELDTARDGLNSSTAALNTAEENSQRSRNAAENADRESRAQQTDASEAAQTATAQQSTADGTRATVRADEQNVENAQQASEQAHANLTERETQLQNMQERHNKTLADTRSSALTDEFDQAIDIEGEEIHYERPDYEPPEETPVRGSQGEQ